MGGVPLQATEHPLHELAERVPAVLFVAEHGKPVFVSPAVQQLLGNPAEHYLAHPIAWERDKQGLHEVSVIVDQRTYGALVTADPGRDPLTGLPARGLLLEHTRAAVARARSSDRSVALLHAGLDGLDLVNAGLGRQAHDTVVEQIAARVREAMPDTAIVGSLADGELGVLLADVRGDPNALVEAAAGQLIVAAGRPLEVDGEQFELTARVGASMLPGDAADEHALLRHADSAMRTARAGDGGGARVLFYSGGTTDALERLLITGRLRRAVERGELLLHFQPIFRLGEGEGDIVAVEALLRWRDPDRGLVPPLDFIPVAEYTGLIEPIGRWVIEACCAQAAAWRAAGLEVPVSFNVSPRQFRDPGFIEALEAATSEHGVPPSALIVEITESVAMREPHCVEPVLDRLRDLGVRLAIDDFGAGYSSLARLRDLEVDLLKIDRGFLAEAATDHRAGRIVQAALDLARALEMTAVAEGVETEQQRRFLQDGGCTLAQGFHLGRPLPADDVTPLLSAAPGRD